MNNLHNDICGLCEGEFDDRVGGFVQGIRACDSCISKLSRDDDMFLIWSLEHEAWWGPNHRGYFKEREKAGLYSFEEALKIVKGANIGLHDVPNEAMIKYEEKNG